MNFGVLLRALLLGLCALCLFHCSAGLDPITSQGRQFFYSNGNQFFVKGVTYPWTDGVLNFDPLQNTGQCEIDARLIEALGANVISVDYINPSIDHSGCINAFANKNIYLLVNLMSAASDIWAEVYVGTDLEPDLKDIPSWNSTQFAEIAEALDNLQGFDNILGLLAGADAFFYGSEDIAPTSIAPYIKAAISDVKAYRDYKGYRKIPVGYRDETLTASEFQNYLACNSDPSHALDFFVVETQCGIGEEARLTENPGIDGFDNFNAPLILLQMLCLQGYNDTGDGQIYMENATSTWSGAIMDSWAEWLTGYNTTFLTPWGANLPLPQFNASGIPEVPTTINEPYTVLQSQWATLNPSGTPLSLYTTTPPAPSCPTSLPGKAFNTNAPLPTLGVKALPSSLLSQALTRTSSATVSPSSSTPSGPNHGGITTGSEIAIGVVIPVVVIGLIIAGVTWYRRKNMQAKRKRESAPFSNLDAVEHEKSPTPHELETEPTLTSPQATLVPELEAHLASPELSAGSRANNHELEGGKDARSE